MTLAEFLKYKLEQAQKKNPRYSLRSLARKSKLPPGKVSELFSGKRKLSQYYADRLRIGLALTHDEFQELQKWISTQSRKKSAEHEMTEAEMSSLASWEHFAILSLMKTVDFKSDLAWIADRLGISEAVVEASLAVMVKVGIIERKDSGDLVRRYSTLISSAGVTSHAIQKAHVSAIQKSLSMIKAPLNEREYTTITMAIDPKLLPKARKMIDRFQDKLSELLETNRATEVYNLNIQLFPLSQRIKNP